MMYYCVSDPDATSGTTECYHGCWNYMQGDNHCDAACNQFVCDYDGGDCKTGASGEVWSGITNNLRTGLCADKCYAVLRNNGQCDTACANEACGWDDNDCCHPPYTTNLKDSGYGSFMLENFKNTKGPNAWPKAKETGEPVPPTILPDLSSQALDRSILGANKLVAGVLVKQTRKKLTTCGQGELLGGGLFFPSERRNTKLGNLCRGSEESTESYGTDPVLLSASSLYSLDAFKDRNAYYNYSNPAEVNQVANAPHGFIHRKFDSDSGFYAFIDINLSQTQAKQYIQYLVDGFFIDELTDKVDVTFLLYNPYYGHFTLVTTEFEFQPGGTITMAYAVSNFNGTPYQTKGDFARFFFELIFLALIIAQLVHELMDCYENTFHGEGFYEYISDPWQLLDWASIILFLTCFYLWFLVYTPLVMDFQPPMRFNVYTQLAPPCNFINNVDFKHYNELVSMFADASTVADTMKTYMQLHGFCLIIVLLRLMKLLDFQPRLGLVTKTIAHAMTDLVHFFVLLCVILGVYWIMSYYLFGGQMYAFSNMQLAFHSNFELLLGSTDYNADMMVEYPIIGLIFFYTFNAIVYFVLLNILLAILVEAYMKVVDDTQDAPSLVQEIKSISRSVFRDWQLGRDHHADSDHPESWMADHYATQEEMMQAFGEPPEDHYISKRKVVPVPLSSGVWLDAGLPTIMKALMMHPDTKDMNIELMTRIACTMVFRFGQNESESVEESLASLFSPEEMVTMAKHMVEHEPSLKDGDGQNGQSNPAKDETAKTDVDEHTWAAVSDPVVDEDPGVSVELENRGGTVSDPVVAEDPGVGVEVCPAGAVSDPAVVEDAGVGV